MIFFILGLVLLLVGAEVLVRGASRLSLAFGLSPLVIGLTVVAFGTSSPELAVGVSAAWNGTGGVVLGNVIGSNVFNVLLILGISAMVVPLAVQQQVVRLEVPLMIGASCLVWVLGLNEVVGRWDGIFLVALLIAYISFTVIRSRRESKAVVAEYESEFGAPEEASPNTWLNLLMIAVGLGMLVLGSDWLVESAVEIARRLEISETVIALTLIAGGTSLPEVATSLMAAIRGERDIAVGNVVGSNLFNLLGVLGVSAAVAPTAIEIPPAMFIFDIPVMVAVAVACLPIFFTGHLIDRWEGALLFGFYVLYVVVSILRATAHPLLETFAPVVLWFVIPLTAITLLIFAVRSFRKE